MSQAGILRVRAGILPPSVPTQFNGNTGSATPIANELNIVTANSTPQFVGAGNTLTLDFGLSNLIIGSDATGITTANTNVGLGLFALDLLTTGASNTAIGWGAGASMTSGLNNCLIGAAAGDAMTTCAGNLAIGVNALGAANSPTSTGNNVSIGTNSLSQLLTGVNNIAIGANTGNSYTSTESLNILIGNNGTVSESNTIRIGTAGGGGQSRSFMAGITGVTVAASAPISVDNNGQLSSLGFGTAAQVLTSNGAGVSPAWGNIFNGFLATNPTGANPADSTTYYLANGQTLIFTSASTNTAARFYAPFNCVLNKVYGAFRVSGTLGTNEAATLFIRLNDTSNTIISSIIDLSTAAFTFSVTGLGISLSAGDYITFGFTGPIWATNPQQVGLALSFST